MWDLWLWEARGIQYKSHYRSIIETKEWEGGIHKNSHIYGWDERPSFINIKIIGERTDLKEKLQFRTLKLTRHCVIQVDMAIIQLDMWPQSTGERSCHSELIQGHPGECIEWADPLQSWLWIIIFIMGREATPRGSPHCWGVICSVLYISSQSVLYDDLCSFLHSVQRTYCMSDSFANYKALHKM